jgi:hypothetical protein
VLNDLAILVKSKKIHGHILVTTGPYLMSMQGDKIIFSDGANKFDTFVRIFLSHSGEVIDKGLRSIGYQRIVLDIFIADIKLNRFGGIA